MIKALRDVAAVLLSVALLTMAVPRKASAYVDPGDSTLMWQLAAAVIVGSLFYVRSMAGLIRKHLSFQSLQAQGFLFATLFAAVVSPLVMRLFEGNPLPRFNDVFLIGIVLTSYLFTWQAAVYLLGLSILASAWVLPPYGTLWIEGATEWYRLASFSLLSVFLLVVIARMKNQALRRSVQEPEAEAIEREDEGPSMARAASGD